MVRIKSNALREDTSARFTEVTVVVQPYNGPVPESQEMGRVSQVVYCDRCGFKGQSRLTYIRGIWTYSMCCLCWHSASIITSLMCLLGEPFWVKRACWDVEHSCVKCGQKLGYNVLCDCKCCGCYSAAYDLPKNTVVYGV